MSKMLIVYYSQAMGNTEQVATALQAATGADIARIDTVTPYTGTQDQISDQGQKEVERGYQPPIRPLDVNVADYDVIAVGTPTWWYTMAPAVLTFMKGQDWTGKTVIPFMTNAGWPGHVIKDMTAAAQGAKVVHGMELLYGGGGNKLTTPQKDMDAWLDAVKGEL